ncbi:phospholipase D-like domain-containing protein [Sphingobium fuliginis]|jgi:phosphatidylserine/phosphatidylglycerophosphate/cardiolipin synthase-like enzyme|uniref:Phospholipase D n=2 Tax=Sphingobium fuliginis (strain ATCC 27551) TaxID=336203 RepID=A0A4Q4ITM7_SPHSA|nr:phospholipase D-like domain-containing protein [Sphingobium fuliginis]QOT74331.1 phospholipase [Sphingobium fuliginis]RYL96697.1 phospholipase [Sphingobium fuliginis]GFZ99388.1 hypothetical protein GCM10019071_32160 [Sphingobium fuliginis]
MTQAKASVAKVIERNLHQLSRTRGFLAAEPGFAVIDGTLVREPAIVAYVRRWLPPESLLPEERLPEAVEGVRIDVVQADPWKALELAQDRLPVAAGLDAAAASALRYEGIEGDPIDEEVTFHGTLVCHAGPDTGWTTLQGFLGGVEERLTVAMYDFSADYIANALIDAVTAANAEVALTIDDDLRENLGDGEESIQERLESRLGARYSASIIFCNSSRRFPSAYHPKVAVRDDTVMWLSSGNWSPASQPPLDPLGKPADARTMFRRGNREWHVIAEDAGLAQLFQRYILHDKAMADSDNAAEPGTSLAMPDLFVSIDELADRAALDLAAPPEPVAPARLPSAPRPIRIQPLLSPDNYARRITEWIEGAERSLYLQYSYIKWSDLGIDAGLKHVLAHLAERSQDEDFDLRIIIGDSSARENARLLAQNGFDESCLRAQSKIHNNVIEYLRDFITLRPTAHRSP